MPQRREDPALRAATTLLVLLPLPAAAEDARPALVEALRANGCSMTEAEAAATLPGLGLVQADVIAAVEMMTAQGEAQLVGDRLTLAPALCSGEAQVGPLPADPDLALARALDEATLRAILEGYARERHCWVQMIEPARTAKELAAAATRFVSRDLILLPPTEAVLELRFAGLLADPGPAFDRDPMSGDLTLRDCTP